ncbi:MAG TPA: hypothetical protein VK753_04380 [Xanthomonadaceae bacterium]|nr:hypothetical protein [Xanthomonadaceae bacterium]
MNGYLLTLIFVLIAFVVIALARMLAHHNLPHPHHRPAGNDGEDPGDRRGPAPGDDDGHNR